jgi:hypothetical protein
MFAAKHLQPDYVKSIPLPLDFSGHDTALDENETVDIHERTQLLLDRLEVDVQLSQQVYDTGILPEHLLQSIRDEENFDST